MNLTTFLEKLDEQTHYQPRKNGLITTTAPEGASAKWRDSYIKALKSTNVVLLYDEDLAGHQRKGIIIQAIQHHA